MGRHGMDCFGSGQGQTAGVSQYSKETSGSTKCAEFLGWASICWRLMNNSAAWSLFDTRSVFTIASKFCIIPAYHFELLSRTMQQICNKQNKLRKVHHFIKRICSDRNL